MSKKRAAPRTKAEWKKLVKEYENSGLSQRDFAQSKDILFTTFQSRVWRVRQQSSKKKETGNVVPAKFVEVSPLATKSNEKGVRVKVNGIWLEFSSLPEPCWLAKLISQTSRS